MKRINISEADVLKSCRMMLNELRALKLLTYRRIHSTGIPDGKGWFRKNLDMTGLPDLILALPGGRVLLIECKSSKGVMSSAQKAFKEEWEGFGFSYEVVNSVEAMELALVKNGVKLPWRPRLTLG